jgi:hypothetical protein
MAEDESPQLRGPDSGEVVTAFTWEVSRQSGDGEQRLIVLKVTNAEGDVLRLGFPPEHARTVGAMLSGAKPINDV